jgi:capsid protein
MSRGLVDIYGQPLRTVRRARFDAATAGGPQRSTPPQAVSVYSDANPGARRSLVAGSRDLADNSPTIRGLVERMVTYVIGSGLWPVIGGSDEVLAREANQAFREFARDCEVRGGLSFAEVQRQIYRAEIRDGDAGAILTSHANGEPALWVCEGNDIGGTTKASSITYFDGVTLDELGRRAAYDVRRPIPGGGYAELPGIPSSDFVHFADFERPGQIRGVPILSAALNTGRDVKEILEIEKLALKDAATRVDIISTSTGEIDPDDLVASGGATLNGSDGEDPRTYYREIGMPESKVIRHGDTWQAYKNDRPSQTWQGFMSFLTETICLAAKIPPSILLQIKVGGADTRRDLAAAERIFSLTQDRLTGPNQLGKILNYVLSRKFGGRVPSGGWVVSWQTPKAPTADAGREAQQDREDVRAGLMTRREYFGRWAQNSEEQADQVEREARDMIARAKAIDAETKVGINVALEMLGFPSKNEAQVTNVNLSQPIDTKVSDVGIDAVGDGATVQDTALNGAQLKSVQEIVTAVSNKQIAPEAAIELLKIALPTTDESAIRRMVDAASRFEPKPEDNQATQ